MTRVRRILVACDASPLSRAAIEAAAALAERQGAELDVLFVEDINVVNLLDHPLVHTYSKAGARRHRVGDEVIQKALELQVAAARAALDEVVGRRAIQGRFGVRRGKVDAELMDAASAADLVLMGWCGRPDPGSKPRLGSVARSLAQAAPTSVVLLRNAVTGPVMALWDGSEAAGRALAVAAVLAARDGGTVELLVPSTDVMDTADLEAQAVALLGPLGLVARHRSAGPLPRLLARLDPDGILVVPAGIDVALDDIPCSVVVAR
ncbi:MAG: universal stress protein [Actinomycetota bacterium]